MKFSFSALPDSPPLVRIKRDTAGAMLHATEYLGPFFEDWRMAIEGARWDRKRRGQFAPLDKLPRIVRRLRDKGFPIELDKQVEEALAAHEAAQWNDLQSARERVEMVDLAIREMSKGGKYLFPYQRVGAEWLATKHGAILADEQGLGKSLQCLTSLPSGAPVLVVCPAVLKGGVWLPETRKWRPGLKITILSGRGNFRWPEPGEIVVINYDILPEVHLSKCQAAKEAAKGDKKSKRPAFCEGCDPFLRNAPEGCVIIFDEAQKAKNPQSLRGGRCRAMGAAVRAKNGRSWVCTGTPVENAPPELWALLQVGGVAQEAFGSWETFLKCFNGVKEKVGPGKTKWTWGSPTADVPDRLQRVMLRRMKADVLPDLPPKRYQFIEVPIDKGTLAQCDELLKEAGGIGSIMSKLKAGQRIDFRTWATTRAALAAAKATALPDIIEGYEDAHDPVIVFSAHLAPMGQFREREGWAVISGKDSETPEERAAIIEDFQAGKLAGIAATIRSAGTGLTLTRAKTCIFVDQEPNPAANAQAEDRIHRLGQDRGTLIIILVANHPLDRRIAELLTDKQALIDASVDAARVTVNQPNVLPEHVDLEALLAECKAEKKPKGLARRGPLTPVEDWASDGLTLLAGEGTTVADYTLAGHAKSGLSDKQWALAIALVNTHLRLQEPAKKERGHKESVDPE